MPHRNATVGSVGVAEGVRAQLPQRLLVKLERATQQGVIVPAGAANPVQQMVDFVDQRFEERTSISFDMREQSTNGHRLSETERCGKAADGLFAILTTGLKNMRLRLDLASEAEHGIGVALEQGFLLLFEKTEECSVLDEFLSQTFGYKLPVHDNVLKTVRGFQFGEGGAGSAGSELLLKHATKTESAAPGELLRE
jgi:hypothetical protein